MAAADELDTLHGIARAVVRLHERFDAHVRDVRESRERERERRESRERERDRRERRRFAVLALLVTLGEVLVAGAALKWGG